jgi:hypothetical protein
MSMQKPVRPAFQSVELDPIDARLEAKAAEKGIPPLVNPIPEPSVLRTAPPATVAPRKPKRAGDSAQSTPRGRMKTLNVEVPDYAWIAIKTPAAQEMVSVRHIIMSALKAKGIAINDADMIEDGRRLRGDATN